MLGERRAAERWSGGRAGGGEAEVEGSGGAEGGEEGSLGSVMVEKRKVVTQAEQDMPFALPLCLPACLAAEAWG